VHENIGRYEQTLEYGETAVAIARDLNRPNALSMALGHIGIACDSLGQFDRMFSCYEEALSIARASGDRWGEGNWLGNIGDGHCELGRYEEAVKFHKEALQISRELAYRYGEAFDLRNLGVALLGLGDLSNAAAIFQQSAAIADAIGSNEMQQRANYHLAQAQLHLGALPQALEAIQKSRAHSYGPCNHSAAALHAIILARLKQEVLAREASTEALDLADGLLARTRHHFGAQYTQALSLAILAALSQKEERDSLLTRAKEAYREAIQRCPAKGIVDDALLLLEELHSVGDGAVFEPLRGYLVEGD
jgi:tetratricopeptide (TPR) repeat protein